MKTLRIVGIGGGTGLPVLLAGLGKEAGVELSAIVTVSDNGGSSGRLREAFSMPAIGDLRNCLVALSGASSELAAIFQHRFSGGGDLEGHSLGNLIVAALYQKTGSLMQAIEIASGLLPTRGRALAATEIPSTLCAAFDDGTAARGESHITAAGRCVKRVWLEPECPPAAPGVLEALRSADAIVLAPGSLYTSLIPNLLVNGVADAIRQSRASKILICNLMTQRGETAGFSASDHLRVVENYLGRGVVGFCIVNSRFASSVPGDCRADRAEPVACDLGQIRFLGAVPVKADLLVSEGEQIRHNPVTLSRLVVKIARAQARQAVPAEQPQHSQGVAIQCFN
jgi:uncharacterized cofD-like protein